MLGRAAPEPWARQHLSSGWRVGRVRTEVGDTPESEEKQLGTSPGGSRVGSRTFCQTEEEKYLSGEQEENYKQQPGAYAPVTPALRRLKQEDCEFRPEWATLRPYCKKQNKAKRIEIKHQNETRAEDKNHFEGSV